MALFDSFKKRKKKEEVPLSAPTPSEKKASAIVSSPKKTAQKSAQKKEAALTPGSARIDQGAKGGERYAGILLKPRITEKSSLAAGERAYTFQVHPDATKSMVKKAIEEVYKLHPVKVNIIVSKPKKIRVRGRVGTKSGRKQAIVYLKKGDKIEFV